MVFTHNSDFIVQLFHPNQCSIVESSHQAQAQAQISTLTPPMTALLYTMLQAKAELSALQPLSYSYSRYRPAWLHYFSPNKYLQIIVMAD
jgi:hypothetical protein